MSAARIAALEEKLIDVEKRHAEAIARLSLAVDQLLRAPEIGTDNIEDVVTKAHMRVNELVPDAWDRVFEEWQRDTGAMTEEELEREHKAIARDRSKLKAAKTCEAGA